MRNPNGYGSVYKLSGKRRKPFSQKEIEQLWLSVDSNDYIKLVLILIYSGVRISELLNLKKEDVHLDEQWFDVKQSKTDSGVRVVPIADKVLPFWQEFMQRSKGEYAICTVSGQKLTYDNFKAKYWRPLMAAVEYEAYNSRNTTHFYKSMCYPKYKHDCN